MFTDLESLLGTCRLLQKLSLENCEVNENICQEIAYSDRLTVLNMSQCEGLNETGIEVILTSCKRLVLHVHLNSLRKTLIQKIPDW